MIIRCLHTIDEMLALRAEIDALNLASPRPDPFSTCEFYVNMIQRREIFRAQETVRLWFLAAFDGDALIGYLALKEVVGRGRFLRTRKLDCLAGHEADRPHVVASAEHLAAVTEGFYRYLGGRRDWDFLELQQQDAGSSLYPVPTSVHLRRCWIDEYPNWDNCTIRIRWQTAQEYFQALSHNLRGALKRQSRKLMSLGRLELISSMDANVTPTLFELYCSIESHSWKSDTDIAIGSDPIRARYFKALLGAQQPMKILVQILLLDGVPIAGLLSGAFAAPTGKGLYGLHMAFHRNLNALAPGSIIFLLGVRHAIQGGFAFFNLLSGFGYYKTRWLADATSTRSVQIYRIGSLLFWRRLCGNIKRYLLLFRKHSNAPVFNPARRSIDEYLERDSQTKVARPVQIRAQERARYETLIAQARQGNCQFASAGDLRVILESMMTTATARPTKQPSRKTAKSKKTITPTSTLLPPLTPPSTCEVALVAAPASIAGVATVNFN